METVVVTGVAGFIGSHVAARLLAEGRAVLGIDVFDDAYDVRLKHYRLANLRDHPGFAFAPTDVADEVALAAALDTHAPAPAHVVHLAARAGVRRSAREPTSYVRTNVLGFTALLEACRRRGVQHLVYASSSSVYGETAKVPFDTHGPAAHPVSVYAATKRATELLAHAYAHAHDLPSTGLRLFTVHGPAGRPDMAYWRFAEAMLDGAPVEVYGDGTAVRDFTDVHDVVEAVVRLLGRPPAGDPTWSPADPDPSTSTAPFRVCNVGHGGQASVLELVRVLEDALGTRAHVRHVAEQPGDVARTWADTTDLQRVVGYVPPTPLDVGMGRFAEWLRGFHARHGSIR